MFAPLSDMQSKYLINSDQLYSLYREARLHSADYRGGVTWKKVGGHEYLYRILDRKGNGKSLGRRSDKTELIYDQFNLAKGRLSLRLKSLKAKLIEQAGVNVALKLSRCPQIVADISIALDEAGLMGRGIEIIGTNALYAYESMAGVHVLQESLETTDVDLLFDSKAKISLIAPETFSSEGILGLLKEVDGSFRVLEKSRFRAVNDDGFLVDLIRQMPSPPWKDDPSGLGDSDLVATDIWNMKWLLSMPKVNQTVIAKNGMPFMMTVPDPRAYALFKNWLSSSNERDPRKKSRDKTQSMIVADLIKNHLPQYKFTEDQLKAFPVDVVTGSGFCQIDDAGWISR